MGELTDLWIVDHIEAVAAGRLLEPEPLEACGRTVS